MGQERILVVGATGYFGNYIAKASVALGHPTVAIIRPSTLENPAKAEVLASLKEAGVTLVPGSLQDHASLVAALQIVDVVISAIGRTEVTNQVKLIPAIKEVGHIKRFLPSEFGNDPTRTHVLPPSEEMFADKLVVQKAVKASGIPYTLVSSNCFAGYFAASLGQISGPPPATDRVTIYGHAKAYLVEESDIATYAVKAAVDPRAENKVMYIRPAHNKLSHLELVELWERKSGHQLEKTQLEEDGVLNRIEESPFPFNRALSVMYSVFVKGDETSFEVPHDAVEATQLFPEVHYTTVDEYLDRFLPTPKQC